MLSWDEWEGRTLLTFDPCELCGELERQAGSHLQVTPSLPDTPLWGSATELGTGGRCPLVSSGHFKINSTALPEQTLVLHQLCSCD